MWLLDFVRNIRDRVEEWQLKKLREEVELMELTLPYEEQVAKERIKLLGLETYIAKQRMGIIKAQTRVIEIR